MANVRIPYADNGTLDASWFSHDGITTTGSAVLMPGYLDSHRYPHLTTLAQDLQQRSWDVVSFSPQGTWESGGKPSEYTITNYLKNARAALHWLRERSSATTTYFIGHSLGGLISLLAAAQDPTITGIVAIMSPERVSALDLADVKMKWQELGERISKRDLPGDPRKIRKFAIPYSFIIDAQKYHGKEAAQNYNGSAFFLAGEQDALILPEKVQQFARHHVPAFPYHELRSIGHDYRRYSSQVEEVNHAVLDFLQIY